MPTRPPTLVRTRPGTRGTVLATLVVVAALAGACATAAAPAAPGNSRPVVSADRADPAYGSATDPGPTPTARAAAATGRAFAADVQASTASFASAVAALQADVAAGNLAVARTDELAAQSAYDGFRDLQSANPISASSLDELAGDVVPGESFGGLHAVERDLWATGPLPGDVAALAAQAPAVPLLLGREHLGPEAIDSVAADQLTWVVDEALPVDQEQYSHLGLVDVDATEQAAATSFAAVEPLAALVDPTRTAEVRTQFAALAAQVAALGPAGSVPESSVTPAARLALSRQLDATASTLAGLDAALAPYGTEGPSS
jgi:iron uptake system component EfeO